MGKSHFHRYLTYIGSRYESCIILMITDCSLKFSFSFSVYRDVLYKSPRDIIRTLKIDCHVEYHNISTKILTNHWDNGGFKDKTEVARTEARYRNSPVETTTLKTVGHQELRKDPPQSLRKLRRVWLMLVDFQSTRDIPISRFWRVGPLIFAQT